MIRSVETFTPNTYNLHVVRTWADKVEVRGEADPAARVTVNSEPCKRVGGEFFCVIDANNAAGANYMDLDITVVLNNLTTTESLPLYVPKRTG